MALDSQQEYYRYRRYFVDLRQIYRQKKARVYTEIVLSVITVIFFVVFAIRPTFVTITGLLKEIKDKKVVTAGFENKIYLIDEALPKKSDLADLVNGIEQMVAQSGLTEISLTFDKTVIKGEENMNGLREIDLSLTVSGDYLNMKNLLQQLTNLRRVISLGEINFQTPKSAEDQLTLTINGKSYYFN